MLEGNEGSDTLIGGPGKDIISGYSFSSTGEQIDRLIGQREADIFVLASLNATLTSSMAVKVAMPLFRILTGAKATKFKSLVSYKIVTVLASSVTDLNLMMTV